MNTTTAYTPLESLLLFQSLAAHGTKPDAFSRISDLLQNNPLVKDGDTYDPGRLSPEALRELYLQLLMEDLKNETLVESHEDTQSKKRKLPSPPPPAIKDSNEYNEKLPQLVDRLYARYRDHMIRLIREDERKYDILQDEIAEIERGEWDERILTEDRGRANKNATITGETPRFRKASTVSPLPAPVGQGNKPVSAPSAISKTDEQEPLERQSPSPETCLETGTKSEGLAVNDVLSSSETRPASPLTESTVLPRNGSQALLPAEKSSGSNERPHGPTPLQPVQQRKWQPYQEETLGTPPPPFPADSNSVPSSPPREPLSVPSVPLGNAPATPQGPSPPQDHPSPQGHPPPQGHAPSSPLNSNSPHPIVLPPSNIQRGPVSPSPRPLDQLADLAEKQLRAPPVPPLIQHGALSSTPFGPPHPPFLPQYRPNDGRPLPANGASPQWDQQIMQPYHSPNINFPPVQPGQRPFLRPDITQPEQRQYNSPYNSSQGPRQSGVEQFRSDPAINPRPLPQRDARAPPHTPLPFGPPRLRTGMATRWTLTPTASTPKAPKSPVQPAFEPLSPVPSLAKLPVTIEPAAKNEKPKARRRGRPPRVRANSPPSRVIARSQSVLSHADELSLENHIPVMQRVKQESSTPRPVDDTGDTTADESIQRPRPSTLQEAPSVHRAPKRKRLEGRGRSPTKPPTHVLWTRNFPKISASALERIGAHRYASTFALPIKERDAPGYRDIILRPQDLKSIRAALVSGSRCGAAAATATAVIGDQGQASMPLPISEDLIPPKSIVNNAQLEKELMRMFANAIMFNPDPNRGLGSVFEVKQSIEGSGGPENYGLDENRVVTMTRDMFSDAEKIVGELRSAERRSEGLQVEAEEEEMDELAGDGDHGGGSVAKRRRRA